MPVIGVGGGRTRDVEHLVLLGLLGDGERDARRCRAGDDVHALADELLDGGDRLVGVARVVAVLDGDGRAVDLARAVGGVVEPGLEAVEVLLAVAGERTGLARDDADGHLFGPAAVGGLTARFGRRRACRQGQRCRDDHGAQEQLLRNPHVRAFPHWKDLVPRIGASLKHEIRFRFLQSRQARGLRASQERGSGDVVTQSGRSRI